MNKLELLRQELKKHDLEGLIVPMNDEFRSEYAPKYARRIEFLTGFTGSSAAVIVTKKNAAFFTDGRYDLQSKMQVCDEYQLFNIQELSPMQWVEENIKPSQTLAIDPMLHNEEEYCKLQFIAQKNSFELKLLEQNLVDNIWKNRPLEKLEKAFIYDVKYAGKSISEKLKEIASNIKNNSADGVIFTLPESINWLLNIRGNDLPHTPFALCYGILYADKEFKLFIDKNKINDEVEEYLGANVSVKNLADIAESLKKLSGKAIQLDPKSAPIKFFNILTNCGAKIIRANDPCLLPKSCKNSTEINNIKQAHMYDGVALCKFLYWLDNSLKNNLSISEIMASNKLEELRLLNKKCKGLSFDTISGFAANGAIIHYKATAETNKEIANEGLYLLDSGGQYFEGTTDVTRTIAIGEPTNEQIRNFTLILKGHIALAGAKFPAGTVGAQLDSLSRNALWKYGLDYAHGTGHGVGCYMNVHEGPQSIGKFGSHTELEEGMVLSNEPGFYKEGEYGIRIESLIYVSKQKDSEFFEFKTLTLAPIDLNLIDKALLTKGEIDWINNYHQEVYDSISPALDESEHIWLKENTAKI